jgi:antitoxin component YwqK of YwqJK toxin-antitoxin module
MKLGLTTLLKNDEVLHRDGFLYCTNSTEPLNAKVERFHDNGQLKEMYTSIYSKEEGLEQMWFDNGQLQGEATLAISVHLCPRSSCKV